MNNSASQFMDKQIMDLSNSQSVANTGNNQGNSESDFIDFVNRASEKEDIMSSYDSMPIRQALGSSSSPVVVSSNLDSGVGDTPLRTWNSFDSKTNASSIRNYSTLDADEPAQFNLRKNKSPSNVPLDISLVSDIDRTMKKYMDNLAHAVDAMSARLSQLETRTRNLESSIDDLKVSVGNNHGTTDGRMRLLENILSEVRTGVQSIMDKQEILDNQLHTTKVQVPTIEQDESRKNTGLDDSTQTGVSVNQHSSNVTPAQPPPLPPHQNLQPQIQLPAQYHPTQAPSIPHRESYFSSSIQAPENPGQQYQVSHLRQQQQQQLVQPSPSPLHHQYQSPPQQQYSQVPPQPHAPPQPHVPPQPHPPFSGLNPSQSQLPLGLHSEESPYTSPQTYSSGILPTPFQLPSRGPSPSSQQFCGPTPNVYEPPPSRPGSGYSDSFGISSGSEEAYPYSNPQSQYGRGSHIKSQQLSSPSMGDSGGTSYPQLPTARILPQALPTASLVSGASGPGGSGNKVPIDDVVDRVTNMGFPRDQVRATVRKLTENGQAVDLNVVLDKLMNGGEGQGPREWFGR